MVQNLVAPGRRWAGRLAFAACVLLASAPAFAQPDPEFDRRLYADARTLWERELSEAPRAELEARWQAIAERARALNALVESLPETDPRRAQLAEFLEAQRTARMQGSGTLRGSHGARPGTDGVDIGARNFMKADALIEEWSRRGLPMTVERLQELNRALGEGLQHNGHTPGEIRARAGEDITAGGRFRYVPGRHVGEAMQEFADWYNASKAAGMAPPELAGKSYMRLVSIHPFWDGNGRTTRMAMNWILRSHGLPAVALQDVMVAVFAERPAEGVPAEKAVRVVVDALEANLAEQARIAEPARGFASRRPRSAPRSTPLPAGLHAEANALFEALREGARVRNLERAAEVSPMERVALAAGDRGLSAVRFEISTSADLLADYASDTVRMSEGLFAEVESRLAGLPEAERVARRAQVLGLIMAHELAHAGGVRAERAADAEALRILEIAGMKPSAADLRAAVDVFARPSGAGHVDRFLGRLRDTLRYGPGRLANLERLAAEGDHLAAFRRADGTLRWSEVVGRGALREGAGLAHFTLALFLKELAVVVNTGDRLRIEEFFDGVLTTDFFATYGLFALGARGGEIAFSRFLAGHLRPGFVSTLLKTHVVLMAGMALPAIVRGEISSKTFLISATSLGLSVSAVKTGVAGLGWVRDLAAPGSEALLARYGAMGSRLARAGAWFYTAGELAVVLYLGEAIEHTYTDWETRRAAKRSLAEAGRAFLETAADTSAEPADLLLALAEHGAAWEGYRNFLYAPLHANEDVLNRRLAKLAVDAKRIADRTDGLLARLEGHEHLARSGAERFGDLEAYAEGLSSPALEDLRAATRAALEAYEKGHQAALAEVYSASRRAGSLLEGGRLDGPALASALRGVSSNRLQAYEDQAELLAALARRQRSAGRVDLADLLDASRAQLLATLAADRALADAR